MARIFVALVALAALAPTHSVASSLPHELKNEWQELESVREVLEQELEVIDVVDKQAKKAAKPKAVKSADDAQGSDGDRGDALPSPASAPASKDVPKAIVSRAKRKSAAVKVEETSKDVAADDTSVGVVEFRQAVNGSTPTAFIHIGTPPVDLKVIFDTGSDQLVAKTWLTVTNELERVDTGLFGRIIPSEGGFYKSDESTTYNMSYRKRDGKLVPKKGFIQYGSGPAITLEGQDDVTVGGQSLVSMPFMEISRDSLSMLHTSEGVAGVLGLQHMKDRTLGKSVFSRLRDIGKMDAFGYCRGKGDTGTFIWGDTSTEGRAVEVIGDMHWAVNMTEFRATASKAAHRRLEKPGEMIVLAETEAADGDQAVPHGFGDNEDLVTEDELNVADVVEKIKKAIGTAHDHPSTVPDDRAADDTHDKADNAEKKSTKTNKNVTMCGGSGCAAIIDTGSNIIAGPRKAIMNLARKLKVAKDCSNLHELPTLEFKLGGVPLKVPPNAYVMKMKIPPSMRRQEEGAEGDEEQADEEGEQERDLESGRLVAHRRSRHLDRDGLSAEEFEDARLFSSFEDVSKAGGVNLFDVLYASEDGDERGAIDMKSFGSLTHLCMPALVPLDKETRFGALWVVGSPLFENYYTRWSFPKGHDAPKIFFEDLKTAKACQEPSAAATPNLMADAPSASLAQPLGDVPARTAAERRAVMRREKEDHKSGADRVASSAAQQGTVQELGFHGEDEKEPLERSASEIMYPYWASNLLAL